MNKSSLLLTIAAISLSFLLGQTLAVKAESKSFAGVVPFANASGLFGLFNQNNGKVYIYDHNIKECLFEGQIEELGKAATTIRAEQPKIHQPYEKPTTK